MNVEPKSEEMGNTAKSHLDSLDKTRAGPCSAVCWPVSRTEAGAIVQPMVWKRSDSKSHWSQEYMNPITRYEGTAQYNAG